VFRQIRNSKITKQKRGKTFFYELPKRVATFLNLANPEKYTGHAIRRTATTWLAERGASTSMIQKFGGWKSASVAQEYIDNSDTMRQTIASKFQNTTKAEVEVTSIPNQQNVATSTGIIFNGIKADKVIIKNFWNSEIPINKAE
jgi:cyclophilin family peptidyl-prolyl cis-trans isomerase